MFHLLSKLRASKARKLSKANADSAFSQAKARKACRRVHKATHRSKANG